MIHQAYCLRDTKAEIFAAPFFVPNDNLAIRLLSELVMDTRSNLGKYPQDFLLYRVGSYNTDTAALMPAQVELVCTASSCLPKPDPRQLTLPAHEQLLADAQAAAAKVIA